jgi:hypothetical protein
MLVAVVERVGEILCRWLFFSVNSLWYAIKLSKVYLVFVWMTGGIKY